MYSALKASEDLNGRPAFVFHGFKPRQELFKMDAADGGKANMESDFAIVLPGIVIGLECKTTLDSKQLKKAGKQWAELTRVLETELGLGPDWKFVRCLAYQGVAPRFAASEKCPTCGLFLLKFEERAAFLGKFHALLQSLGRPSGEAQFKSVVRDLLVFTSEKADCGDVGDRIADAYSTRHAQFMNTPAETAFFWSPAQYDIIKRDKRFVLLKGGERSSDALIIEHLQYIFSLS